MWIKTLIAVLLLFVVINLFRAFFVVVRGQSDRPASHYLGRRVLFSAVILIIIVVSIVMGWIPLNPTPY